MSKISGNFLKFPQVSGNFNSVLNFRQAIIFSLNIRLSGKLYTLFFQYSLVRLNYLFRNCRFIGSTNMVTKIACPFSKIPNHVQIIFSPATYTQPKEEIWAGMFWIVVSKLINLLKHYFRGFTRLVENTFVYRVLCTSRFSYIEKNTTK